MAALACLLHATWPLWGNQPAPDPIGSVLRRTGQYALSFLVLSLVPTAIRRVFGFKQIMLVRRTLGLYAFLFAVAHFLTYFGLDYAFDVGLMMKAIPEERFVLAGVAALAMLIPLAVTSTAEWQKRLGQVWKRLHRLVYLATALAVLHYAWTSKEIRLKPLLYGGLTLLLLLLRLPFIPPLFPWRPERGEREPI